MTRFQPTERFYYLPLTRGCVDGCEICSACSCSHASDRDLASIERLVRKAKSAEFHSMIFPAGILLREDRQKIFQFCSETGIRVVLQMDASVLSEKRLSELAREIELNLILTGKQLLDATLLQRLEDRGTPFYLTLLARKQSALESVIESIPTKFYDRVYFHVQPMMTDDPHRLTVSETHRLLSKIRKRFPGLPIRPPRGHEVWDARIDPMLGLEPEVTPSFSSEIAGSRPRVSVVIPSYNSGTVLMNVVRHLLRQTLPREEYEIILVDDGSTDGTEAMIRSFVAPEASHLNLKFIRFPRPRERRMGDGQFRAGISRNLGVKHSRGEYLCFLDADMIVDQDHLSDLLEKHRRWDVIQNVRLHLHDETQNERVLYPEVDQTQDTYILEKNYWGQLFNCQDWSSLPLFWKYTCTYALSLKTAHFKEAGWFRRTFVYYGFEDTDLGYRLAAQGRSFYLNPKVAYHLSQGKVRSEYRNSDFERHLLLSKTAKVFYLNNLDPIIYEHFKNWMGGEWSIPLWFRRRQKRESLHAG